jgi:SAM-dependent methyltransferase
VDDSNRRTAAPAREVESPLSTIERHYDEHLGPVYLWMAGGAPAALAVGAAETDVLNLAAVKGATVVDLGAGFGMHALGLAQRGTQVTAIDSSATMLRMLKELRGELQAKAALEETQLPLTRSAGTTAGLPAASASGWVDQEARGASPASLARRAPDRQRACRSTWIAGPGSTGPSTSTAGEAPA